MKSKCLITSALPYANGPLHFGHIAGAYLPADCYARFMRQSGCDVLYICGSDEYGVAITLSAELVGKSPQEHVDLYHRINKELFEQLSFSFDHFSRTSWEGHVATTQQFFSDLLANGYIEERETDQLYSEQEKKFLADRYVTGICPRCNFEGARGDECQKCGASYEATDLKNPHSKLSGLPLIKKPTTHWFLRFDLFKEKLSRWLSKKAWKKNVIHFAASYLEDLKPRAITRDLEWGVPLPLGCKGGEGKVLYVWFDAPIGYISATKEWAEKQGDKEAWKKYWLDPETHYVQFIGKDNIPFHALFFPAMVMGQNTPYKLVDELPANEFLNLEGRQFSKSEGWTIDLTTFFDSFTADQIRYALAANAPETHDAEFSWKDFQHRCNGELLGKYGNLANRILVFTHNQCGAKIPPRGTLEEREISFLEKARALSLEIGHAYKGFHLRKACALIMDLAQLGNGYFDGAKPWLLVKDPQRRQELENVISCCLQGLKMLSIVSFPVVPATAQKLWSLLGYAESLSEIGWDQGISNEIPPGQQLPPVTILFKRIEDELIEKEEEKLKKYSLKSPHVI